MKLIAVKVMLAAMLLSASFNMYFSSECNEIVTISSESSDHPTCLTCMNQPGGCRHCRRKKVMPNSSC
ncbi:hypothetical protein PGT21_005562 [Puccinia graminis f. sp. tritici]|uniref:Uncharacterized protein n=1 Tax=Puccinia graminis f. sp. tritici TaxID=56615 RepID=A0A5B0PHF4_PUCGR|nr:hypothetical protein PGT21_005562 [Puccinia graminis f. sp. tritici]